MFPKAQVVDFWMKDTILPLDMIFIRANGVVDSIARNQPPFSLVNTFSAGPVIAALEIPAGTADRLGLKVGEKVTGVWTPIAAPVISTGGPSATCPWTLRQDVPNGFSFA